MIPILIDMDGVLRLGEKPAEYLNEFIDFLKTENFPFCIVSNSTFTDKSLMQKFFEENGVAADFPIMTAVDAAYFFVKENYSSIALYCSESVKHVFKDLKLSETPEAVVIGDLGEAWNFEIMNDIFLKALNGAKIVAMQKNKFWKHPERGYLLDAGAFVSAIEYASDKRAILIGKPSPLYFQEALKLINSQGKRFVMIGDDLNADLYPLKSLGGTGILILTGKTSPRNLTAEDRENFYVANNLPEVIEIIRKLNKRGLNGN